MKSGEIDQRSDTEQREQENRRGRTTEVLTSKLARIFGKALDLVFAETHEREDEVFNQRVEMRFEESESRFGVDTVRSGNEFGAN
jgi:hypothetical protein